MNQIIILIFGVFIFSYWIGVAVLVYHLYKFGYGKAPKRLSLSLIISSILLSILLITAYTNLI